MGKSGGQTGTANAHDRVGTVITFIGLVLIIGYVYYRLGPYIGYW